MTRYLLSVVTPADGTPPAPEELQAIMKNVEALHREMVEAGAWVFSGGLEAPETATVVRPQDGDLLVTDGPFVEAKEFMGGFYLLDVEDEARAVELATQIPDAQIPGLALEIRPVVFADLGEG